MNADNEHFRIPKDLEGPSALQSGVSFMLRNTDDLQHTATFNEVAKGFPDVFFGIVNRRTFKYLFLCARYVNCTTC